MRLEFDANEPSPNKWYASTNDGGYDGAGQTPLDAVCALVTNLEREIYNGPSA